MRLTGWLDRSELQLPAAAPARPHRTAPHHVAQPAINQPLRAAVVGWSGASEAAPAPAGGCAGHGAGAHLNSKFTRDRGRTCSVAAVHAARHADLLVGGWTMGGRD